MDHRPLALLAAARLQLLLGHAEAGLDIGVVCPRAGAATGCSWARSINSVSADAGPARPSRAINGSARARRLMVERPLGDTDLL